MARKRTRGEEAAVVAKVMSPEELAKLSAEKVASYLAEMEKGLAGKRVKAPGKR